MIGEGGLVVDLRRLGDGGAAVEGGEHDPREREVGEDESGARGAEQRRAAKTTAVRGGSVSFTGEITEPGPPQCAMGHEPPSLVSLRSGGVHNVPLVLIWWPRSQHFAAMSCQRPRGAGGRFPDVCQSIGASRGRVKRGASWSKDDVLLRGNVERVCGNKESAR